MKEVSTEPYKGVRDFYPRDWAQLTAIFSMVRSKLERWGYEEYQASPLERAELYEAKTSEEIVSEQTYTFTDRGDRRVTLRPEMTPTLARMVAAKRRELTFPLRWFSIGNRFRYERPQRGRLREFYQIDVDLVGLPEGEADLEVICLASSILKGFDIGEDAFVIRVNSRALLNAACASAGLSPEATRTYLRLLDRQAKMTPEDFRTAREAITHEDPLTHLNRSAMESFIETLRTRGVMNAVFDPTITRGFDYYTGLVFEVFDTNPVNPRSLFGGGRYDGLVELYGGEPIPAVGFAIGDVTLADFLETHNALPPLQGYLPELYLGTPSPADSPAAQLVAARLRSYGCRIVINISSRSLGDQIKEAVKRGIPHFAAYGSDEASRGTLKIKTLSTGHEEEVRIDDVPGWLTNHSL